MPSKQTITKAELEARLEQLRHDYELSRTGLFTGWHLTNTILAFLLCLFGCAAAVFISRGESFLSGYQFVAIVAIFVFAIVIYFAFVFARRARLRAQITRTKQMLEMCAGESVR